MLKEMGQWEGAKLRPNPDLHLDPKKEAYADPKAEAEHRDILDQIADATPEQLGIIQRNIATALEGKDFETLNKLTKEKVIAVFKRSRELLGVTEIPDTLH